MKYLVTVIIIFFIACSDETSSKNPLEPMYSGEKLNETSSSLATGSSSSEKLNKSSSSLATGSSSSEKLNKSSSSLATRSSSSEKLNKSSSSLATGNSSSEKLNESSSSLATRSSSSEKLNESSSSLATGSSSSEKLNESSSSLATGSSSSEKLNESSSSLATESSSSTIENSSSSLAINDICKTATVDNCVYGTLYDERDGKTYKTVKIGEQEWMAENLNYEVTKISKTAIWTKCYENSADSCAKYGRFYTWTAVIDSISLYKKSSLQCGYGKTCSTLEEIKIQGVCPEKWHLPNQKEWEILINYVGPSKASALLKSIWENWNGEDSFGFSALPSGRVTNASVDYIGNRAYFWTRTDHSNTTAVAAVFYDNTDYIIFDNFYKSAVAAALVRCIRD